MQLHLDDLYTIASTGYHCAFTSCLVWRGDLYLAYREAQTHSIYPPGNVVLVRASLAEEEPYFEHCHVFNTGGDDRDPKLFDAGKRGLGILWGTYYPRWPNLWQHNAQTISAKATDVLTHASYSRDGMTWSPYYQMFRPNYWVWSVCNWRDAYYAAAYHFGDGLYDDSHSIHLLRSLDTIAWWHHGIIVPETHDASIYTRKPSEPCLFVGDNDELSCIIRQEETAFLLGSISTQGDGRTWSIKEQQFILHSPAVTHTPHGYILGGRALTERKIKKAAKNTERNAKKRYDTSMNLWAMDGLDNSAVLPLELPSWGDCGYPGLAWDDANNVLWCSYYSQHAYRTAYEADELPGNPTPADVCLAKIRVEE